MLTIISYDIANDRSRYKVSQRLLDDAQRVQKSVFEAPELATARFLRLRSDLEGLIEARTDSLRYYRLCRACAQRREHVGHGVGLLLPDPSFEIIG